MKKNTLFTRYLFPRKSPVQTPTIIIRKSKIWSKTQHHIHRRATANWFVGKSKCFQTLFDSLWRSPFHCIVLGLRDDFYLKVLFERSSSIGTHKYSNVMWFTSKRESKLISKHVKPVQRMDNEVFGFCFSFNHPDKIEDYSARLSYFNDKCNRLLIVLIVWLGEWSF